MDLVDYTGRLFRQGKASISAELAGIFERLNFSAQSRQVRLGKLRGDRLLGRSARVSCIGMVNVVPGYVSWSDFTHC
jgi:hypothetical protein